MCTALSIKLKNNKWFFGRNMELAYNFNESVMLIPRGYKFQDKVIGNMIINNRSIIGIGTVIDEIKNMAIKYPDLKIVVCHLTAPVIGNEEILEATLNVLNLPNIWFDLAALPGINMTEKYPFSNTLEQLKIL